MSGHWRLALWCAIWVAAVAVVLGGMIWARYGPSYAGAFGYGAGVGIVSFFSGAPTVSLLTQQSKILVVIGALSFIARYFFAAAALAAPAYWELWPVLSMVAGFAGAYLVENLVLLPGSVRVMGSTSDTGKRREERVERRAEI